MQTGIDSFAAAISDPATGLTLRPVERMHHSLEEIELADRVGLEVFGIGEHHRAEFLDSAPVVILSAAATRTENICLTSAVMVLSACDPVRIFQEFSTLDFISREQPPQTRRFAVSLNNVTAVSKEGEEVLSYMMRQGAKFTSAGVLTKYRLKRLSLKCQVKPDGALNQDLSSD
jgi:hypothetical protein